MTFGQVELDALVTGQLTHYALWLEDEVIGIISDYFAVPSKKSDFDRLLLRRDGLTFQNKIEVVRAMAPLFTKKEVATKLKSILGKVGTFKEVRNAFAHGRDVTPEDLSELAVHVQIVTRSGRDKTIVVNAPAHRRMFDEAESLLEELRACRSALRD